MCLQKMDFDSVVQKLQSWDVNFKSIKLENINNGQLSIICALLKKNTTVTKLDLSHGIFDSKGIMSLVDMILHHQNLISPITYLDLSYGKFTYPGLKKLFIILGIKDKISTLILTNNSTMQGENLLFNLSFALRETKTLKYLDISNFSHEKDETCELGVWSIADVLKRENTTLEHLKIKNVKGCSRLLKMLRVNNTLKTLDISGSSDISTEHLAALHSNTTVVSLILSNCNLTQSQIITLCIALTNREPSNLQYLDISGSSITSFMVLNAIKDMIHDNITLKTFKYTYFDDNIVLNGDELLFFDNTHNEYFRGF